MFDAYQKIKLLRSFIFWKFR